MPRSESGQRGLNRPRGGTQDSQMGSVSKTKRPSIIESVTVNIVWHECLSTLITTADPVTGIKEGSWGREDQAACLTRVQAAWTQRSSHLCSEGSMPARPLFPPKNRRPPQQPCAFFYSLLRSDSVRAARAACRSFAGRTAFQQRFGPSVKLD